MSKGFCDHCFSWGPIADPERNMCDYCKERENGNKMRNERPAGKSVRALSERNTRGRGSA